MVVLELLNKQSYSTESTDRQPAAVSQSHCQLFEQQPDLVLCGPARIEHEKYFRNIPIPDVIFFLTEVLISNLNNFFALVCYLTIIKIRYKIILKVFLLAIIN